MQLPSKELLSEVLADIYNPRIVEWMEVEDNYLRTYYDCGRYDDQGRPTGLGIEINIYELANKCKEWILAEGYSFFSYSDDNSEWYAQCKLVTTDIQPLTWSVADTEPDAVFEAAEWVRQQKEC